MPLFCIAIGKIFGGEAWVFGGEASPTLPSRLNPTNGCWSWADTQQSQSQQVILVSFNSWVQAIACPEVVKYVVGKAKVFCLCAANDALLGPKVLKPSFLLILLSMWLRSLCHINLHTCSLWGCHAFEMYLTCPTWGGREDLLPFQLWGVGVSLCYVITSGQAWGQESEDSNAVSGEACRLYEARRESRVH